MKFSAIIMTGAALPIFLRFISLFVLLNRASVSVYGAGASVNLIVYSLEKKLLFFWIFRIPTMEVASQRT